MQEKSYIDLKKKNFKAIYPKMQNLELSGICTKPFNWHSMGPHDNQFPDDPCLHTVHVQLAVGMNFFRAQISDTDSIEED